MRNYVYGLVILLCVLTLLAGCGPGGRKKMPNNLWSGVSEPARQFYEKQALSLAGDTVLELGGRRRHYVSVHLPERQEQLEALFRVYAPHAGDYLAAWPLLGWDGVVINMGKGADCMGTEGEQQQSSLVLEGPFRSYSIPVLVVWDRSSASQASFVLETLAHLSSDTGDKNPGEAGAGEIKF